MLARWACVRDCLHLQSFAATQSWCRSLSNNSIPSTTTSSTYAQTADSAAADSPPVQTQLIEKFLGPETMSKKERLKLRNQAVIREFQRFEGDVGSSEVQIALLTERIRDVSEHFAGNKKDFHNMRGLQGLLSQRRALLKYLRRKDFDKFCFVAYKLGLRDIGYAKQARFDKYRVGSKLGSKAEPIKRYGFK
eukprot:jgi/Chrzof1/3866/Cz13g11200.t1